MKGDLCHAYSIDELKIETFKEKIKKDIFEFIDGNEKNFIKSIISLREVQDKFSEVITNSFRFFIKKCEMNNS